MQNNFRVEELNLVLEVLPNNVLQRTHMDQGTVPLVEDDPEVLGADLVGFDVGEG